MEESTRPEYMRRRPLHSYFIIAFAISWIGSLVVAGPSFLRGEEISTTNVLPILLFMLAGPSIAGMLITYVADGRQGLYDLFRRMRLWNTTLKWYGFALFIPPTLIFISICIRKQS